MPICLTTDCDWEKGQIQYQARKTIQCPTRNEFPRQTPRPPSEACDPEIFFLLAMAFQQQNQHNEAMELFELLYQNSPEQSRVKDFKKAVKKTEKIVGGKILPKGMFG